MQPVAAVALAVLLLGVLVGGHAVAGNSPNVSLMWPAKAALAVVYYPQDRLLRPARLNISWPAANGADHYRVTVLKKMPGGWVVVMDSSPATYSTVYNVSGTYVITVTAYDGPDEATAYSESLQTQFKTPRIFW